MKKVNIFEEIKNTDVNSAGIHWLRQSLEKVEQYLFEDYDMNRIDEMTSDIKYLLDENLSCEVNQTCESMLEVIESLK
jgi:hypothetical protein